jgi:hypothetical protein
MKVLHDFAPIPMSASEAAHRLLPSPARGSVHYELHLPSSEELLREILKRPTHFVTEGKFAHADAEAIFDEEECPPKENLAEYCAAASDPKACYERCSEQ